MSNATLSGNPYAGNPYVWFDWDKFASAKPVRRFLCGKKLNWFAAVCAAVMCAVKNNSADWAVNFANSFVQGFDVGDFADKANAYFYGVVTSGDPCFMNHVETGDNGASALRLRSNCPAKARPVWLVGTTAYIYDDVAQPAKPWRKVIDRGSYAASVTGLALDSPLIPDAFGAERRKSNNACGPLCAHTGSTIFVLR